jgi:molecular chaperone GrpE
MSEDFSAQQEEQEQVYSLDLDAPQVDDPETVLREAEMWAEQQAARREGEAEAQEETAVDPDAVAAEVDSAALDKLHEQLADYKERSVRALADFENYRKRVERERAENARYAVAEVLRDFIEVSDNLERALEAEGPAEELKRGVEMIVRQVEDLFRRYGVHPVAALGEVFDPTVHEAVMREEQAGLSVPTVIAELQRGYRIHDRLLRPAMVRVGVPVEAEGADE